ncbi:MAG TPA: helix-turn-helix transcriptional regulator [Candidatus Binatia bacterium]|jgi:AraC-like DNA-binding protein|nr:helix-turn-helix transcriptional regulator [Candidatus Binatia bacterium]
MKTNGLSGQQLVLKEIVLLPGGEWTPRMPGWSVLHLTRGVGYWMNSRSNHELSGGSVLMLSERGQGLVRASQLGETVFQYFYVQPEKLSGVMTLAEQKLLDEAARKDAFSARLFFPDDPVAENFKRLCQGRSQSNLRTRVQLLELFIHAVENDLNLDAAEPVSDAGARARLEMLLKQMHAADMLDLSFGDLAARVGCCPRHLGRVFQEVVGTSFREKQAQVRLGKAQELLATSKSKVVEVALESGYQSLSLFNLMFKRRFGVTPAQWRQRPNKRKVYA